MGGMTSTAFGGFKLLNAVANTALPLIGTAGRVANTIGGLTGSGEDSRDKQLRAEQNLALKQLQQQQRFNEQQGQAGAALDRERIALDAQTAESQRRAALRRAVARQTAQFGASSVGSGNGSSQAVLLGMFDESQEDLASRERLDGLRNRAIDLSLENQRGLNVLQRTQLKARQNLQRQWF